MKKYSSGNKTVDQVGMINFTGNVIPHSWYSTIQTDTKNPKPYLAAITILSEIVYWYRPQLVRDEQTGEIIGYNQRFREDLLQKSYKNFADFLGLSKDAVKRAMDRLEEIGVIRREFRTVKCGQDITLNNVLFIDLDVEVLKELTFPDSDSEDEPEKEDTPVCKSEDTLPGNFRGASPQKSGDKYIDYYIDHNIDIYPSLEAPKSFDGWIDALKKKLDYFGWIDSLTKDEKALADQCVEMMAQLFITKKKEIRIGSELLPIGMVRSRLEKIDGECLRKLCRAALPYMSRAKNKSGYLQAILFNAIYGNFTDPHPVKVSRNNHNDFLHHKDFDNELELIERLSMKSIAKSVPPDDVSSVGA